MTLHLMHQNNQLFFLTLYFCPLSFITYNESASNFSLYQLLNHTKIGFHKIPIANHRILQTSVISSYRIMIVNILTAVLCMILFYDKIHWAGSYMLLIGAGIVYGIIILGIFLAVNLICIYNHIISTINHSNNSSYQNTINSKFIYC